MLLALVLLLSPVAPAAARGTDSLEAREQARLCGERSREAGVEACRKALELGLSKARAGRVARELALKLTGLGRWDEAVAAYRELAEREPGDADVRYRFAAALLHGQGQAEAAVTELREALTLAPADPRIWGELGAALSALGRPSESVSAFEEALKLDPQFLELRPAARLVFEAARKGERWP
jgi:tetratricopeptide (TPR) repeat protein